MVIGPVKVPGRIEVSIVEPGPIGTRLLAKTIVAIPREGWVPTADIYKQHHAVEFVAPLQPTDRSR